jgi:hypothetical protein
MDLVNGASVAGRLTLVAADATRVISPPALAPAVDLIRRRSATQAGSAAELISR